MTLPYLHPSMILADVLDTVASPEISDAGGGSVLFITQPDMRRHLLTIECAIKGTVISLILGAS